MTCVVRLVNRLKRLEPFRVPMLCPVVLLLAGQVAWSQPNRDNFVTRSFRGANVLRVDAELEMPPSMAFGTVHVSITDVKGKSPADRDLSVVFYTSNWGSNSEGFSTTVPVRLAEGQTSIMVDIPFVHAGSQSAWDVAVFEEGRELEDKRQRLPNTVPYQYMLQEVSNLGYAAIAGSDESASALEKTLEAMASRIAPATNSATARQGNTNISRVLAIDEASADWRRYFPFNAWFISAATTKQINQSYPQVAKALRTFVSAGGTLLVHGADSVDDIGELEKLLSMGGGNFASNRWQSEKPNKDAWWHQSVEEDSSISDQPNKLGSLSGQGVLHDAAIAGETWLFGHLAHSTARKLTFSLGLTDDYSSMGGYGMEVSYPFEEYRTQLMQTLDTEEILTMDYLGGTVLLARNRLDDISTNFLHSTLQKAPDTNACTLASSVMDGNWFWRNLNTAVGKPPVWSFCAMVTLFGALLGPGLLYFTGRMGRRSLMIFLVPAISLTATLAIITYGVLHEGFDTYIRVTSVSRIDSATQVGFTWSRQNYFSGLPAREGLNFRLDTYARPVLPDDEQNRSYTDPRSSTVYRVRLTDQQNWRGWLKPRRQQQLLIGHAIPSPISPVQLAAKSKGVLEIVNSSGQELPFVLVRGAADDYYFAESIAPDTSVSVQQDTQNSVRVSIARLAAEYRPQAPPELRDGGSLLTFGSSSGRFNNSQNAEAIDVLNRAFRDYMSERLEMVPFSYSTLLNQSEGVEIPVQGNQSNSLHLVIGVQPW